MSSPPLPALEALLKRGRRLRVAPVAVNAWAIRAWCAAIGDLNPLYLDPATGIAPPPMLQSWVGPGLMVEYEPAASLHAEVRAAFAATGFSAVVATDYAQEYLADVKVGDRLQELSHVESVSALKLTRLGTGHFVTIVFEFPNQSDHVVGRLRVQTFYFKPALSEKAQQKPAGELPRSPGSVVIPVTTTLVIAGALASNDFEKVHHDREVAQAQGLRDIIMSIITTTGLVARAARELFPANNPIREISLRLETPVCPGDTLVFSGEAGDAGANNCMIVGQTEYGKHVRASVVFR